MLQQEVRAGFAASSASNVGLQVEVRALRTEVQQSLERKSAPDEIAMAVQQSVRKALLHDLWFFFYSWIAIGSM